MIVLLAFYRHPPNTWYWATPARAKQNPRGLHLTFPPMVKPLSRGSGLQNLNLVDPEPNV